MAAASYLLGVLQTREEYDHQPHAQVLIRMSECFDQRVLHQPVPLMPIFSERRSASAARVQQHSQRTELATTGTMDGR